MTREEEDEVEDWSDMEGVEREELFVSRHAQELGAPVPIAAPRPAQVPQGEEKGMGNEEAQPAQVAPGPAPSILKRPETAAAELAEAKARWEKGDLTADDTR